MHSCNHRRVRQTGLSLIELMIGIALGLLLTAGILQLFIGTKNTYSAQDGVSKMQESARFGAEFLNTEMRMAALRSLCYDYYGSDFMNITNHLTQNGQLLYSSAIGVWGWDYDGTGDGDTYTLPADLDPSTEARSNWTAGASVGQLPAELQGMVVPGSDVLLIKRVTPLANWVATSGGTSNTIPLVQSDPASGVNNDGVDPDDWKNDLVLVTNCQNGDLFVNTSDSANVLNSSGGVSDLPDGSLIDTLSNDGTALGAYGQSAQVYRFNSTLFFIGQRAAGGPTSLYRANVGAEGDVQELVENVESMQVLFGITDDPDVRDQVSDYVTADEVSDWSLVLSARIGLLMRAPGNGHGAVARSLEVNGLTVDEPSDGAQRTVFVMDSTPRNLVRIYPY